MRPVKREAQFFVKIGAEVVLFSRFSIDKRPCRRYYYSMDRSSHSSPVPAPRETIIPFAMAGINMLAASFAAWSLLAPQARLATVLLILLGVPISMALSRRQYNRVLLNVLAMAPLLLLTWWLVKDMPGMQIDWSRPLESIMSNPVPDQLVGLLHILVITAAGRAFLLVTAKDLLQTPIPSISIFLLATIIPASGYHPETDPWTLYCLFLLLATSLGLFSQAQNVHWFPKHTPILVQKQLVLRMTQFMLLAFPFIICIGIGLKSFNMVAMSSRLSGRHGPIFSFMRNGLLRPSAAIALSDSLDMGGANWPSGNQQIMTVKVSQPTSQLWRGTTYDLYEKGRWQHTSSRAGLMPNSNLLPGHPALDPGISAAMITGMLSKNPPASALLSQTFTINAATLGNATPIYGAYQILRLETLHSAQIETDGGVSLTHGFLPSEPVSMYTVRSYIKPLPNKFHLREAVPLDAGSQNLYTQMPDGANGDFARRVRARAVEILSAVKMTPASDPYAIVQQLDLYLGQHYLYSLTPSTPRRGTDPILDFLFHQRQGYCVYFSGAMVMLCRSIGIPARMAVGFATGEVDMARSHGDTVLYKVTADQAHAWVEVYLPHYGWFTADPTAGSAQAPSLWGSTWDVLSQTVASIKTSLQQGLAFLRHHHRVHNILLLALLILPAGWWGVHTWRSRRLPALPRHALSAVEATDAVLQAYGHLQRWLQYWGVPRQPGLTALERLPTLRTLDTAMAPSLEELSQLYLIARYSNRPLNDGDARRAWELLQHLRTRYRGARRQIQRRVMELAEN